MSAGFRAVQWNRAKLVYDGILLAGVTLYIGTYILLSVWLDPPKDEPAAIDVRIRAFGTCAFFMLTIILSIGPLARLDRRFLPLLYNRRHFGVLTFFVALLHASFMIEWFAVQNALPSLYDELTKVSDYGKFIGFPFKALGLLALLILFVMAATSHDFWLAFLTPPVWKSLHMALYVAYGLVVMHVALGVMQYDRNPVIPVMLAGGFLCVTVLHLVAGWRERAGDLSDRLSDDGWLSVGRAAFDPGQGRPHRCGARRRAHRGVSGRRPDRRAVESLRPPERADRGGAHHRRLRHLPWHGYQYRLEDGCAPAPFTEKLATYRVRVARGMVEVDPRPLAPGTPAANTYQ